MREYISYKSASFPTHESIEKRIKLPIEEMRADFSTWDVTACYETEKHLLVRFSVSPTPVYSLLNKVTKEACSVTSLQHVLGYEVCASTGREFVSYFLPLDGNIRQIQEMVADMDDYNKKRIAHLSTEDNPVLVLFSFD